MSKMSNKDIELRRYMLFCFSAKKLAESLALLTGCKKFKKFANNLINECEQAFYSQCVDFALEKMSHKILDGTSLDFKEAVTGWVTERLNKSGTFVSLEIPYYLTESGCNESIEFNPKNLLN